MTKRLAALLLAALILPGAWVARAQETPTPDPGEGAVTVAVDYGAYTLELEADEPLAACVVERRVTLDGASATVVVFVRHDDGSRTPLGTFSSEATAALQDAAVGSCLNLGSN